MCASSKERGTISETCNHIKAGVQPWVLAYSENNRDTPLGGLTTSATALYPYICRTRGASSDLGTHILFRISPYPRAMNPVSLEPILAIPFAFDSFR